MSLWNTSFRVHNKDSRYASLSLFSLKHKFPQIIRELSQIITTFVAIQPALGMGGSRHFGFRALKAHRSPQTSCLQRASPRSRKRTFSERYLLLTQLRNLILPEDTATRRPCWVYYTRMPKVYPFVKGLIWYTFIIIRDGVGWLSCLSR